MAEISNLPIGSPQVQPGVATSAWETSAPGGTASGRWSEPRRRGGGACPPARLHSTRADDALFLLRLPQLPNRTGPFRGAGFNSLEIGVELRLVRGRERAADVVALSLKQRPALRRDV